MAAAYESPTALVQALRSIALAIPDCVEGVACQGTPLESHSFGVRGKSFLFLTLHDSGCTVRLKLRGSQAEATRLGMESPGRFVLGAHGWATVTLAPGESAPSGLIERWIDESYRVVVGNR